MNAQPLVSAIIIFHNEERFIEEAIESVIAQTYANWELLLCDDGSFDRSTEIAKKYADNFPDKITYLEHEEHENRGMSATRNLGIRHAKGEFIAWLDADDVWLPQKLQRQMQLIIKYSEAAMVYGPVQLWHSWAEDYNDIRRDIIQEVGISPDSLIQPPQLLLRFFNHPINIPSGVLIKRKVLEDVNGYDDTISDEFEDEIVHFKVCLKYPVFVSSESWYRYRQHPNSYCAKVSNTNKRQYRRLIYPNYLKRLSDYLREQQYDNREVWQMIEEQESYHTHNNPAHIFAFLFGIVDWVRSGFTWSLRYGRKIGEKIGPQSIRSWVGLQIFGNRSSPPPGWIHFGNLRRLKPISRAFGHDRGQSIDEYYIEQFLKDNESDIKGSVLEIGNRKYTLKFGADRVTNSHVLYHLTNSGEMRTYEAEITEKILENTFDCIILTKAVPFIYDLDMTILTIYNALKSGGVFLATLPGISQISQYHMNRWGTDWRFTSLAARRALEKHFEVEELTIRTVGNVLISIAYMHGLSKNELRQNELDYVDPDFEVLITIRAAKT